MLCHLVRNYNHATHNNRARPRPCVIYTNHPESDRANGPRIETTTLRGPGTRSCLFRSVCLSFAGQPRFEAILYHPTAVAELRVKPHIGDAECRGTDRIRLPCGLRRYLRSIISGIYRCRRQPRAVLRPTRANDIPWAAGGRGRGSLVLSHVAVTVCHGSELFATPIVLQFRTRVYRNCKVEIGNATIKMSITGEEKY